MRLNQWGVIEEEPPEPEEDEPEPCTCTEHDSCDACIDAGRFDDPRDYPELDYDMVVEYSVCIVCKEQITMQARTDDGKPDGVWRSTGPSEYGESICYADYAEGSWSPGSYLSPPELEPYPHEPRVQAWEVAEAVQSIQREIEARGGPA